MATDQFCLRWNNFQVNITSALESLKCDEDLVDVTLTCDGQNVKAHKVILSACSPYFRNVFKENPCQHPVVILKDVRYEDVTALLNFMYQGEVYITQDRLAPFLHTAELLQVRGLAGATNPFKESQTSLPSQQQQQLQQLQQQPQQQLQKQQQQQQQQQQKLQSQQQLPKAKKSLPQSPGSQLRRLTPPLSVSPSSLSSSGKVYTHLLRAPRTALLSPKEPLGTASNVKEKPKETSLLPLNKDLEPDPSAKCQVPASHQTTTSYPPSVDHPCPPYSPAEQPNFPALTSPVAFHQSGESSPQPTTHQYPGPLCEQSPSQPSSPQPAAKRRKALPRRVSSSHVSTDDPISPAENSSEARPQSRNIEEYPEFEGMPETNVSVKEEHADDIEEDIPGLDEDSSSLQQNSRDAEEMMMLGSAPKGGGSGMEEQYPIEHDAKDEGTSEGGTEGCVRSALLRSLTAGQPQGEGSPQGGSGKVTTLPHVPQCGTCPHCGQTYSNQSALKYHVRLMHTDMTNRHCCHLCPRSFALRDVFKAHMWSKHKQRC